VGRVSRGKAAGARPLNSIVSAPMLRRHFAVSVLVAAIGSASGSGQGCPDLSGHYTFFGTWEHRTFEGGNAESIAAFTAANPEPRLDRFALGMYAREIMSARFAVLRHDLGTGIVEIDVIGDSGRLKLEGSAPKLPVNLPLACSGSAWLRDRAATGGGENVRSEERERIVLRVDPSGDLLAKGRNETTVGWILKTRSSWDWVARFRRIDKHQEK
jgi:hypothetical protein